MSAEQQAAVLTARLEAATDRANIGEVRVFVTDALKDGLQKKGGG